MNHWKMDANYPDVVLRPGGGRRCKVVFSYQPQNDDELELKEKDEIEFISEVEEGWWRGRLAGRVGVFPSNFVVELPPTHLEEQSLSEGDVSAPLSSPEEPVPVLPPKPVREQCRVLFSYDAAIDDELTLVKGDIVTIITKDVEDKGWWKGELRGKIGLFPDNFVEIITPVEEVKAKQPSKPDRPAKNLPEKVDSKTTSQLIIGSKKQETEIMSSSINDLTKAKSADLGLIKPDTVAAHRKSLEEKVANESKKPPQRPPVSGKPKPSAASKPTNVKRLSAEITDLVDGALQSKLNSRLKSLDVAETPSDDLDLDVVGRSDLLTNITASRPRAPGRRPTSYAASNKEHEGSILTNGSAVAEAVKVEISPKEKQKQHLPFIDELKVNLKSSKPVVDPVVEKKPEKSFGLWGSKVTNNNSLETSSTIISSNTSQESTSIKSLTSLTAISSTTNLKTEVTKTDLSTSNLKSDSNILRGESKVSELSSVFDEKVKGFSDTVGLDPASKKDISDLRIRVDKLERTVSELVAMLKEEVDKRRQVEKELVKLTDLVTQV